MTTRLAGIWFTGFALVLALAYDIGFYEKGLGVNFLVFMVLAALGFVALAVQNKLIQNRFAWWLVAPTLALATAPALYNNEFALYAAPILAGLTWLVFAMSLTIQNMGLPFYLIQLPLWSHLDQLITNWKNIYHDLFSHEEGKAKKIVWGLVIAFPILLVFAGLLASADPIFADWLKNLNIWESIWRVFRTLMMTLFIGAFFYLLASDKNHLREKVAKVFKLDAVTVGVVLALVNALFGLFVYIQIRYLFGGTTFVLGNGITIAEYARSGFFELVRVLILAAVLIIGTHRSFAHHGSHWIINTLQALFIAQIGVVAASALYRMGIYQDTYGYTSLRLYVQWFIYAVMGALVFSGIALVAKMQFRRFFQVMLAAVLVVASVVSLINVDVVIARENISRFKSGKDLDMYYLNLLSRDAAPQVVELFDPETLGKLNISQTFTLQGLVERYNRENASTTLFATDWSKIQSEKVLSNLPEHVKTAFDAAKEKDKKYQETSNAVGANTPSYVTCLEVADKTNDSQPQVYYDSMITCAGIGETATTIIQAQIFQKYESGETDLENMAREVKVQYATTVIGQNVDIYYRIVEFNKKLQKTEVKFEQQLYKSSKDVVNYDALSDFRIQKDGSVIEINFAKREIYQYKFLFENGQYKLEPKQNYSV